MFYACSVLQHLLQIIRTILLFPKLTTSQVFVRDGFPVLVQVVSIQNVKN